MNESIFGPFDVQGETGISFESELRALVVVAHPDDETLWSGGTILMYPDWSWRVACLSRGADWDRRTKFFGAMTCLGAQGSIGNMDDGPEQRPLSSEQVEKTVLGEINRKSYDLIITHSLFGEYTRHRRHEEVGCAVLGLWRTGKLSSKELWMFAYTDRERSQYPEAIDEAHLNVSLPESIWKKKLAVIRNIYGFSSDSWEAMTTPRDEAFWRFKKPEEAFSWQKRYESRISRGTASDGYGTSHVENGSRSK